ncbi:hypothetical protein [Texcoconibacillus texcoconensis]|uniref:Uncharacterized protein n=1 Tax=Texcoconibacillus texcoconensis TaxID=1095777 RepID=A0A840QN80_9BACI|nr:hypothetical protein [Texcoconibacillus texcoconensis]MBB5172842.1 hypothetical protein [Texcoconibacillus texcoconensis]
MKNTTYWFIGGSIFILLVGLLIYLYAQDPEHTSPVPSDSKTTEETNDETADPNLNFSERDDLDTESPLENDVSISSSTEKEAREENAKEAFDDTKSWVEASESLSSENDETHFYLLNLYYSNLYDYGMNEEDIENDSIYFAEELTNWESLAIEQYNFQYDEDDFHDYIDQKRDNTNDEELDVLLDTVKDEQSWHDGLLRVSYLQGYIWENIKEDLKEEHTQAEDESDDAFEQRLYDQFESQVIQ